MPRQKPHLRLRAHCIALRAMLATYLRLIKVSAGQWRLMFEARAATVKNELSEVCEEPPVVDGTSG